MPISFQSISANKIPTKQAKKSSPKPKATISKPTIQNRNRVVVLPPANDKLFEPVIIREKPIIVEFVEYFSSDGVRFSKDGFFAIKLLAMERRCYLIYFKNPITPQIDLTLEVACQESMDYIIKEFQDSDDFRRASQGILNDATNLSEVRKINMLRLRNESALGQVELEILAILREQIIAERFVKRQRLIEKQNEVWKLEYAKILKQQEEEEKEDEQSELVTSNRQSSFSTSGIEQENSSSEEVSEVKQERIEEESKEDGIGIQTQEVRERTEPINQTSKSVFVWGGKK